MEKEKTLVPPGLPRTSPAGKKRGKPLISCNAALSEPAAQGPDKGGEIRRYIKLPGRVHAGIRNKNLYNPQFLCM